jgi:hypothetical protein
MHSYASLEHQLAASPIGMIFKKNIPSSRKKRPAVGEALMDESNQVKYSLQSVCCRVKNTVLRDF